MYKPTDKMGDLICENYALLQVMSRFGISLGFGDKSVFVLVIDWIAIGLFPPISTPPIFTTLVFFL